MAESWPAPPDSGVVGRHDDLDVAARIVPGAELHEVHRVPGGSLEGTLVRPHLGDAYL